MAVKKVWFGSVGPFLYNDEELIADSEGDLAGVARAALSTAGQLNVALEPTEDTHVLRLADFGGSLGSTIEFVVLTAIRWRYYVGVVQYKTRTLSVVGGNISVSVESDWIDIEFVSTPAPTTLAPTTLAPTTAAPTTSAPTTLAPTTAAPTTQAPTTAAPTTLAPTTLAPTTAAPTTPAPTTSAPTTSAPTTAPPTTPP